MDFEKLIEIVSANSTNSTPTSLVPVLTTNVVPTKPVVDKPKANATIEEDADYIRQQLYDAIEQGNVALRDLAQMAQSVPTARNYEVFAQLLKSLTDSTDKLMKLHKEKREVTAPEVGAGPKTVYANNAVFVGSTQEALRAIKQQEKGETYDAE